MHTNYETSLFDDDIKIMPVALILVDIFLMRRCRDALC